MKQFISIFLLIVLSSCAPAGAAQLLTPTPQQQEATVARPTRTKTSPVSSPVPATSTKMTATRTPRGTEIPRTDSDGCISLIRPQNNTNLPPSGHVTFQWHSLPAAQSYVLTLVLPSGRQETSLTSETSLKRFVKSTDPTDFYRWTVTAYDAESQVICTSSTYTFSKLAIKPTATRTFIVIPTITACPTIPPHPTDTRTPIVIPPVEWTPTDEPPTQTPEVPYP